MNSGAPKTDALTGESNSQYVNSPGWYSKSGTYRCDSRRMSGPIARVRLATVAIRTMYDTRMRNGSTETVNAAATIQSAFATPRVVHRIGPLPKNVSMLPAARSAGSAV